MTSEPKARRSRPDLLDRVQSAVPLLALYFGLAALYAWQASRHPVPTIFTDELELTQLARAIAETGEPARRGEPYGFATLVAYVLAPVWWLGSATASYATAKLVLVLAMTATVFPAYGLARLVVTRWYALAAAGAATTVPALAYSSILVEEPLAYPLATLALWLIARMLAAPSWGRLAAALAVCAASAWTRTQLVTLFVVLVLGLLSIGWDLELVRRWRRQWSRWDWVGATTLVIGLAFGLSAAMGHVSTSWRETTFLYKDRIFDHATWAVGALAIGVGVLPLLAGIAALARPKGERRDPETRAFVVTSAVTLVVFLVYAGVKGAYISTVFSTLVVERNIIYLCPILFAATALAFTRGIGRGWAIAGAAIFTVYVVNATPLRLDQYPYYEAHGLSIAAFANRELGWAEGTIEYILLAACALALIVVLALKLLRQGSLGFVAIAATTSIVVVAWSMTAQVYAAEGERIFAEQIERNLPTPYDWVEQATDGASVVVIGQQISDPTGVWLTEFFNPSIRKVWSLDGTAPPPGPILTPDLAAVDGTLAPPPKTAFALALNGVELLAPEVARRGRDVLYRLDGAPLKIRTSVTGLYTDGWMADNASYNRFDISQDGPGFARIKLSREDWCGKDKPARATVRIGPVLKGPDKQAALAKVLQEESVVLHSCEARTILLGAPNAPWRVEIAINPTFSPNELDPSKSDRRQLGAKLEAGFLPLGG